MQYGGIPRNASAGDAAPDENARILGIAIVPAESCAHGVRARGNRARRGDLKCWSDRDGRFETFQKRVRSLANETISQELKLRSLAYMHTPQQHGRDGYTSREPVAKPDCKAEFLTRRFQRGSGYTENEDLQNATGLARGGETSDSA